MTNNYCIRNLTSGLLRKRAERPSLRQTKQKAKKYLILLLQFSFLSVMCLSCKIFTARKDKKQAQANQASMVAAAAQKAKADSAAKAKLGKLKKYEDVITKKAITRTGLLTVHQVENRYFFEVPNHLLEKDLLVVNRIAKGPIGSSMGLYAGDQLNEKVIHFAKGPDHKLFIKNISHTTRATGKGENSMYQSVLNSSVQPIVAAFDVKALNKDSSAMVIDVTDYLNTDNDVFGGKVGPGVVQPDKSFINTIKTHPLNMEIRTTKTFLKPPTAPGAPGAGGPPGNSTFEINSSVLLLPEKPMSPRMYDDRVGYFATGYTDFDANPQGVKKVEMITRFRLEPKDEDKARYLAGELVEPKQPIIFYIDPTTPKKWVPYLIQGVNDWSVAFEKAGFKNAIIGKEAPTSAQDSTWSIDDARHNAIVYKPSDIPNAMGPHVHDPRSGEILETHISWFHNVMKLLRDWYFIQAAPNDPRARKMQFDEELMGELIRFVSSHEVGHTLGLRHNMGASNATPVEKLRDKAWVEANGHTSSIMDYARFNYVAQPEDGISEKGIFPRIGDYDKWAIEWGYRWWPEMPQAQEAAKLNQWIIERTTNNKRLWFGSEMTADPRSQTEDLGDNAMLASSYGVRNLQRIVPRLLEWTREPNEDYGNLKNMYKEVTAQFQRYIGHVSANIGGIMNTPKTVEEKGPIQVAVPKRKQKDALNWLQQEVFETPEWLLNKDVLSKTGDNPLTLVSSLQSGALGMLLFKVGTLANIQVQFPANAYPPVEFLNDLEKGIWSELKANQSISIYRRSLQKSYVGNLIRLSGLDPQRLTQPPAANQRGGNSDGSEVTSIGKVQLKQLQAKIKAAIPKTKDQMSRYHLIDCLDRINAALKSA